VPGCRGLPGLERGEDLEEAADERPDPDDQYQYQRGGPRPHQGDHPGGQVDQAEEQVAEPLDAGNSRRRQYLPSIAT
jgi:hypothetical protein